MITDDEILSDFLPEAQQVLDDLERVMIAVDGGADPAPVVAGTFRALHTLKGTAGFIGFRQLEAVAHAGEDLLATIRSGGLAWTRPITDALLEVVDAVRAILTGAAATRGEGEHDYTSLTARLREMSAPMAGGTPAPPTAAAPTPPPEPPAPPPPAVAPLAIAPLFEPRAPPPVRKAPTGAPAHAQAGTAPPAEAPTQEPQAPASAPPSPESLESSGTLRVQVGVLDQLMNLVGELVLARNQLLCHAGVRRDGSLTAVAQRVNSLTGELQEAVMKARMQPIGLVFQRLPRVLRDTARTLGKSARLETLGSETELDKTLIEAIKDPLSHVLRNAVDHGIEDPAGRAAAGKPTEGVVRLRAFQEGGQLVVVVEDDGRGVDLERVRAKAVRAGLLDAQAAARLAEPDVLELLFRPGFSTAESVTNISGRGVGMDVARTNVERVGGTIDLSSRPGLGTSVRIRLPLTLVIVPALVVSAAGERYAVPQAALLELVRVGAGDRTRAIVDVHGAALLRLRGALLPLADLAKELGGGAAKADAEGAMTAVVLTAQGQRFGLLVDDVADTEEVVVKSLARQLQQGAPFSGATVRGDGRVALVLDVLALAKRSGVLREATDATRGARPPDGPGDEGRRSYLILRGRDDGRLAVPLSDVARLEKFPADAVEHAGGREVIQYRGGILPLVRLGNALLERRRRPRVAPAARSGELHAVIQQFRGALVGLVVDDILDVVEVSAPIDATGARRGVVGCARIQGRVTEVIDSRAILASQLAATAATEEGHA